MPIQISNDIKVGTMVISAENSMEGYLLCNGSLISRTVYSDLFSTIGTTFGTGNGSTTFGIPDLRGAVPRGAGTSSGYPAESNVTVTLGAKQNDAMQGHSVLLESWFGFNGDGSANPRNAGSGDAGPYGEEIRSRGFRTLEAFGIPRIDNETRMKNLGVNFFIKF